MFALLLRCASKLKKLIIEVTFEVRHGATRMRKSEVNVRFQVPVYFTEAGGVRITHPF
jgi:hypothetical protein